MINHPIWLRPPTIDEGKSLARIHKELEAKTTKTGLAAWLPDPNEYRMYASDYNFWGIDRSDYATSFSSHGQLTIEGLRSALDLKKGKV